MEYEDKTQMIRIERKIDLILSKVAPEVFEAEEESEEIPKRKSGRPKRTTTIAELQKDKFSDDEGVDSDDEADDEEAEEEPLPVTKDKGRGLFGRRK